MVPVLGVGMNSYPPLPSDEGRFELLDRALELGAIFWDSSDHYGDSEELLGKWFRRTGMRDRIFLATKFGYVKGSESVESVEVNSSASYCKKACEESLRLLGIDSIDLYYVHSVNPETPIEETMRAMAELKAEGKIKHIGLSTVSSATLRRACKIAPVAAVQTEYSVFSRGIENSTGTNLLATCRELGIAVVVATPLDRGILTSTFSKEGTIGDSDDSRSHIMPRFQEGNRERNVEIASQLKLLADRKGCTMSQLALAWLLKQGDDIFPIPGTKQLKYLEENWDSQYVYLTHEEEAEIRAMAESTELAGKSVPPQFEGYVFRDTKEETE